MGATLLVGAVLTVAGLSLVVLTAAAFIAKGRAQQPPPPLADEGQIVLEQDASAARLGWSGPTHTAAECTDVRLDAPGAPLHGYRRACAPEGRCYAVAAAVLYDAWRASHGVEPGGHTSPLEAAIHYQVYSGRRWALEGGYACEALDLLAGVGGCDAERVEAALGCLSSPADLRRIEECHAAMLEPLPPSPGRARRIAARCGAVAEGLARGDPSTPPPFPALDTVVEVAATRADLSPLGAMHLCLDGDRLLAPGIPPCRMAHATGPPGQLLARVDAFLDAEPPQPAGLAWCLGAVSAPGVVGVDWRSLGVGEGNHLPMARCIRHFSPVIGRRWHEGRCQYLVYEEPAHVGGDGKIWVDARTLGLNTFGVYGL